MGDKTKDPSIKYLGHINSPTDLKKIPASEIPLLSDEIRRELVRITSANGGHLASNLGVVELTLAIHRVFDLPRDHLIFDVGHQSYVHKMLTGRYDRMDTLRTSGGISGFTNRRESEYDCFGAGHSSTSLSAALGFAISDKLAGNDRYTVAVIGDGAYTGGMIHEALNNCRKDLNLIIVMNENEMSISKNIGRFATSLSNLRKSQGYFKAKRATTSFLKKIPLIGKPLVRFGRGVKKTVKNVLYGSNYFENLGLYYLGTIDGNDYDKVEKALKEAKRIAKTVVVHIKTKKGKGYDPAEESPDEYHSLSSSGVASTFHSVFSEELIRLADSDEKIIAVTAAMGIGTGLDSFGERYPDRYYDVGIAEEHALTFSAGLAAAGFKPYAAIYSTFLQRSYDNILHDVALQSLPVKMIIDRAGLAVSDGATHHGIFDVAFLSHIPNIEILAPATYGSLRKATEYASGVSHPIAIRYSNASESERVVQEFEYYKDYILTNFKSDAIPKSIFITYGTLADKVLSAADIVNDSTSSCGVIVLERLKPYARLVEEVKPLLKHAEKIIFAEEGIKKGGAAMSFIEELINQNELDLVDRLDVCAIDDSFASPDTLCDLFDYVGLSAEKLAERMMKHDR